MSEFYANNQRPKEIVVSEGIDFEFWEKALECKICLPKAGNKYKLSEFAKQNAVDAIRRKVALEASEAVLSMELETMARGIIQALEKAECQQQNFWVVVYSISQRIVHHLRRQNQHFHQCQPQKH